MEMKEALEYAVSATFANMAFMDAEPGEPADDLPQPGQIVAVEFLRPLNGWLLVHLSVATKRLIVENIHGVGWESLTGAAVDDCLMELVNVMAGNFLVTIGADEYRHALSLPQVFYDREDLGTGEELVDYYFLVQDELTKVSLKYQPDHVVSGV